MRIPFLLPITISSLLFFSCEAGEKEKGLEKKKEEVKTEVEVKTEIDSLSQLIEQEPLVFYD